MKRRALSRLVPTIGIVVSDSPRASRRGGEEEKENVPSEEESQGRSGEDPTSFKQSVVVLNDRQARASQGEGEPRAEQARGLEGVERRCGRRARSCKLAAFLSSCTSTLNLLRAQQSGLSRGSEVNEIKRGECAQTAKSSDQDEAFLQFARRAGVDPKVRLTATRGEGQVL